jgi:hypothetical protein
VTAGSSRDRSRTIVSFGAGTTSTLTSPNSSSRRSAISSAAATDSARAARHAPAVLPQGAPVRRRTGTAAALPHFSTGARRRPCAGAANRSAEAGACGRDIEAVQEYAAAFLACPSGVVSGGIGLNFLDKSHHRLPSVVRERIGATRRCRLPGSPSADPDRPHMTRSARRLERSRCDLWHNSARATKRSRCAARSGLRISAADPFAYNQ